MVDPLVANAPDLPSWSFFVAGQPVTQGNHRAFMVGGKPRVTEKKPAALALWRHSISDEARRARGDAQLLTGPVSVELLFWMPKPSSAPKRRRIWPIGARSGDCDKLARAGLDAMTGVLFADDSQVVYLAVSKDYAGGQVANGPGVTVIVRGIA